MTLCFKAAHMMYFLTIFQLISNLKIDYGFSGVSADVTPAYTFNIEWARRADR